jgi:cytochrome c oxidase assembly protein Cox11
MAAWAVMPLLPFLTHPPDASARFNADTSATMRWQFRPQQSEVVLVPGETALAFYTATNPSDEAIVGISTYNVIPFEVTNHE